MLLQNQNCEVGEMSFLTCSCLHSIKDDEEVVVNVARDITATLSPPKEDRDSQILTNIQCADLIHGVSRKRKRFLLPQRAAGMITTDLKTSA